MGGDGVPFPRVIRPAPLGGALGLFRPGSAALSLVAGRCAPGGCLPGVSAAMDALDALGVFLEAGPR